MVSAFITETSSILLRKPAAFAIIADTEKNDAARGRSYKSIPGHPRGAAPLSVAWEGKSLREICRQLKDANLDGGRDLAFTTRAPR
jgi:hypothetical protein